VEGDGSQGKRPADIKEFANIQIEAVVQPEVADKLLERLANDFFPRYAMIAFESEVRVLRREKF
jgi:nitrogen regulatory protein P-II 2